MKDINSPARISTSRGTAARAKRFFTALIVFLLILCALPNLYPNKNLIQIQASSNEVVALSLPELKSQLEGEGFKVKQIESHQGGYLVELENRTLTAEARAYMAESHSKLSVKVISASTMPQWLESTGLKPIKLGLDLDGGVLFVLKVDTEQAAENKLQSLADEANSLRIKNRYRNLSIPQVISGEQVEVIAKAQGQNELVALTATLRDLYPQFTSTTHKQGTLTKVNFRFAETKKVEFDKQLMTQALSTLRSRIEELGITEAVTQRQGTNYIRIELPGVQDPEQAKRIIGATAKLSFHALQEVGGQKLKDKSGALVSIDPVAIFGGDEIESATAGRDEYGKPLVQLFLSSQGGEKINRFSRNNVGKPMATVFSEYYADTKGEIKRNTEVISVATIQQVLNTRFSITNMQSMEHAQELALLLRAGSLDAPITIVKEQTIGPSLGEKNIESGFKALALGLSLTLLFMAVWYRKLGAVAITSLLVNLVCLIGLMSLLPGVVLTLPGIAGLVLTIGMAVDTNVIIFERVRELRRKGIGMVTALKQGYQQAMSSIIDANLTTMITALILLGIGYGPVKGFAITLALGIVTSIFAGVVVSGMLSESLYSKSRKGVK
ncbi:MULTISPECIES: protein translocase subunit SecD [Pseudoalteromonas]|uniref:protein translocase subunit SecD n=1 Tax=Pseudoalteromonas TaxID=53246 RepID=UPI000FFF1F9C|nr:MULTISPECIES: protein translocase subunit SecD [unclassified Pseudoalteromonas]MCG9761708.1 protein translocase subunit SecD [Pseudoalteromonas sp. Isolate6]RXE86980.1 protein translocase subunit SecD [Pseudoalteromonas sp. A757]